MEEIKKHYIIEGGQTGSDRLKILSQATWPNSRLFLQNAGIKNCTSILDLGCGNAENTLKLYDLIESFATVTGIDADETNINHARLESSKHNKELILHQIDLENHFPSTEKYDFIYLRFLISHVSHPERLLENVKSILKPGGAIAIEDVDFDGHFSHPKSEAFDQYVELYKTAGQKKGADPLIGPKLLSLLKSTGYRDIQFNVTLPTFSKGPGKLMGLLTLKNIKNAVIESELIDANKFITLEKQMEEFTNKDESIMSLPRIFQVWAKNE